MVLTANQLQLYTLFFRVPVEGLHLKKYINDFYTPHRAISDILLQIHFWVWQWSWPSAQWPHWGWPWARTHWRTPDTQPLLSHIVQVYRAPSQSSTASSAQSLLVKIQKGHPNPRMWLKGGAQNKGQKIGFFLEREGVMQGVKGHQDLEGRLPGSALTFPWMLSLPRRWLFSSMIAEWVTPPLN